MDKILITKILIALFLMLSSGCVQMRDYTGVKEGAFGLDIQKGFGDGNHKKDYYLVKDGQGVVAGDKKNEVVNLMGLPDRIESTLEGYEGWFYENRNIILLFKDNKLDSWRQIEKQK